MSVSCRGILAGMWLISKNTWKVAKSLTRLNQSEINRDEYQPIRDENLPGVGAVSEVEDSVNSVLQVCSR